MEHLVDDAHARQLRRQASPVNDQSIVQRRGFGSAANRTRDWHRLEDKRHLCRVRRVDEPYFGHATGLSAAFSRPSATYRDAREACMARQRQRLAPPSGVDIFTQADLIQPSIAKMSPAIDIQGIF